MHYVDQTVFGCIYGNCVAACLASIFEFPIKKIPNFWKETQDAREYWKLTNEWLEKHYNYRLLLIQMQKEDMFFLKDILCIALGPTERNGDHAVVWRNEMIHDPHPSKEGLSEEPNIFAVFFPKQIERT